MSDFDLSMVVRAREDGVTATGQATEAAVQGVSRAQAEAAGSAARLSNASEGATRSANRLKESMSDQAARARAQADAIGQVVRATNPAVSSQSLLDAAVRRVQAAFISGKVSAETYALAQRIAARATQENVEWQQRAYASQGQMRVGSLMLGQQIQDIGMQLSLGTGFLRVFAMQAGQTALAVQQMTGGASKFASFIGSVWGSVLLAGVSILALFATNTDTATESMQFAEKGANALSEAQSVLGGMFDLTSGKIEHQNALLIANARLTAINLRADAMSKRESANQTFANVMSGGGGGAGAVRRFLEWSKGVGGVRDQNRQQIFGRHIEAILGAKTPEARAKAIDAALRETELRGNTAGTDVIRNLSGVSGKDWRQALVDTATAAQNDVVADLIDKSLNTGTLAAGLRHDAKAKHPRKKRTDHSAERLQEFGEDARDRIAGLTAAFEDQPPQVEKVRSSLRQLDDLLDDIARKKPPNFQQLLRDGVAARQIIEDGINKPYRDFVKQQTEGLAVQRLLTQGREDEADALQIEVQLEKQIGPLLPEQRDAILAIVQARKAEERQLDIIHQKQQKYLDALSGVREAVRGIFDFSGKGLKDLPKRLGQTLEKLIGDYLFEKFFGKAFRELEDQVKGVHIVEDASTRMGDAIAKANDAIRTLADAATAAAQRINDPTASAAKDTANQDKSPNAPDGDGSIVITGQRTMAHGVPTDPVGFFSYVVKKLLDGLHVFSEEASSKISKAVGTAMEGAAIGGAVGPAATKILGLRGSKTGAQIGGAVGAVGAAALGLPPELGAIVGGIQGSIIGGLFKKAKTGSATITNAYDLATTGGNNQGYKKAASALAQGIQDSILNIAEQLGGGLGAFSVSIGQKDGKFRVDPTGKGNVKTKQGAVDFGDDQAAATAYAVLDAIKDGAVTGLSSAVQAALQSSPDLDRALREALKVQKVEELIGGVGSQIARAFKDFDRDAEDRVRIAKKYGLDLLAVEKINATERIKLVRDTLESRVGSLLSFQKDMAYGNLFQGDAPTRRTAILSDITEIQKEAEAGLEGAADKLADLYRTLLGTSEEAFGTAGPELPADRNTAAEGVARVIEMENERIAKAAGLTQAQLDAIKAGNDLTDETNALIAISNTRLDEIAGLLGGGGGGAGASTAPAPAVPVYDPSDYGGGVSRFTQFGRAALV